MANRASLHWAMAAAPDSVKFFRKYSFSRLVSGN